MSTSLDATEEGPHAVVLATPTTFGNSLKEDPRFSALESSFGGQRGKKDSIPKWMNASVGSRGDSNEP